MAEREKIKEDKTSLPYKICLEASAAVQQSAGVGRYVRELSAALIATPGPFTYSYFYNRQGTNRPHGGSFGGHAGYQIGLSNKPWRAWLNIAWRLGWRLDPARLGYPALFHGTDMIAPPLPGIPLVITVHDLSYLHHPEFHTFLNRQNLRMLVPPIIKHADHIITGSAATARDIEMTYKVPPERLTIVPYGVSSSYQPIPEPDETKRIRVRGQFADGASYILYVGTMEPRKNIEGIITAFAILQKDGEAKLTRTNGETTPVRLVVAGKKGWRYEKIFTLVREMGLEDKVLFPGYIAEEELPALFGAAEFFVYPSFEEGFGLPIIEALACGIPTITANNSALPEAGGEAALYVRAEDPHDIAAAMRRYLDDPDLRAERRIIGLAHAAQFTWTRTARETLAVYQKCLAKENK